MFFFACGEEAYYTYTEESYIDGILHKNPFRYRGYYYDNESGFYYLKARYYDPEIRRFISADSMNVLMIATVEVSCKNLFTYGENNPVANKDSTGMFIDTVFDVISLIGSIADVCESPNDPVAWACLAGDAADVLIPGVAGIGEAIRGAKTAALVSAAVQTTAGLAAGATVAAKNSKRVKNFFEGFKNLGKRGTDVAGKYKKASLWDELTKRKASVNDLHANPLDEFSDPRIGPSDSAVAKYIKEINTTGTLETPIEVQMLSDGGYEIVNGHHRWLAAQKVGLENVPIQIKNYNN